MALCFSGSASGGSCCDGPVGLQLRHSSFSNFSELPPKEIISHQKQKAENFMLENTAVLARSRNQS